MLLPAGARIGAYDVTGVLGAGGMGEVYRARDSRLKRDVALKVLPAEVGNDPERLARFEREAEVLASLNHPNIAHVYGFERDNGVSALVMELVEGQGLDQKIASGVERRESGGGIRQGGASPSGSPVGLPLDEVLHIAKEIAEAVEAAHEAGIIHRDLKPANVKVRADGTVKVLDFGLAKAIETRPTGAAALADSPTIGSPVVTVHGAILGTAAYMSPEQARGRPVDKRADIWAFGCVLYEMLTGARPFGGDTVSDTLASVLTAEPDYSRLPASTPPAVAVLLRRCLDRDVRTRLRDIGEARVALTAPRATPVSPASPGPVGVTPVRRRSVPWWALLASAVAGAIAVFLARPLPAARPDAPLLSLGIEAGADTALAGVGWAGLNWVGPTIALSPDGRTVVFIARGTAGGRWQLYVRRLDQLQAAPLPGSEGAYAPFFSPDGESVGFFAGGRLMKIALAGGTATPLAVVEEARGGAWAPDGTIVFAPKPEGGLFRVSADGGDAVPITAINGATATTHRWPQLLPGGTHVLFTAHDDRSAARDGSIEVQPLAGGPSKVVHRGGLYGRYSASGHLLFVKDGTLFAAPFDRERLEVTGQPVAMVEDVAHALSNGTAQYAVADTGLLAYRRMGNSKRLVQWMDPVGQVQTIREVPAEYQELRLSSTGAKALLVIGEGAQSDVWIHDLGSGRLSRLTFHPDTDRSAIWSHDDQDVAYGSWRADVGTFNLFVHRADGRGEPQRLTTTRNPQLPVEWHPSGRFLLYTEERRGSGTDLMVLPLERATTGEWRAGEPRLVVGTPANEAAGEFSPDGRWMAYTSDESGRTEVYVQPFPGPGGRWQVSTEGAEWVEWYKDLMYGRSEEVVMSVPYRVDGGTFVADTPRVWMRIPPGVVWLDPSPDSSRAAVIRTEEVRRESMVLLVNFFEDLRKKAGSLGPR